MGIGIDKGDGIDSHSFTPVRRPETSVNTKPSCRGLGKEWTANRCHRLLRPLTSRIAILEKEASRFPKAVQVCKRQRRSESVSVSEEAQDVEDSQASDAEWTHQPTRKRIRRTYSARGGRKDKNRRDLAKGRSKSVTDIQVPTPGEILVPTPMLNRTRERVDTSMVQDDEGQPAMVGKRPRSRYLTQDGEAYSQLSEIRRITTPSRFSTYEGIYNGLEALLKATVPDPPEMTKRGAASLFLTCLKATPRYIAEEQALISAQAEENGCKSAIDRRDISSEIYNDLEAFGVASLGWKHLKTVVRSHGIQVISDAIQHGLFDVQFCGALVTLCVQVASLDAAELILSSALSVGQVSSPKTVYSRFSDDPTTHSVSMLWKYVGGTGHVSYHYRQLSRMLAQRSIPLVWLATKDFGQVWTGVIQSLSWPASKNADALGFMNIVLPLLMRPELIRTNEDNVVEEHNNLAEALQQTFLSVLTTLSTIAILSKETTKQLQTENSRPNSESPRPEYDTVSTLLKDCLVGCKLSYSEPSDNSALLLVSILTLVSYRTSGPSGLHANLINPLLSQLRDGESHGTSTTYSGLVTFICSVARCCGRGTSTSGLEYLQELHRILEASVSVEGPEESGFLFDIIVDSAFAFSQQAPDRKHLYYAESINTKYHGFDTQPRQRLSRDSRHAATNGFRWEEGINEWVTATPAVTTKKSKAVGPYISLDDSECDTPFRSSIYRKTNSEDVIQAAGARVTRALQYKVLQNSEDDQAEETNSDDLDGSFASGSPSQTSCQNRKSSRGFSSRRRRVGGKMARASLTLQILEDESNDELSFGSNASQEDTALRVVKDMAQSRTRRSRQTKAKMTQFKPSLEWRLSILENSEDELGI